MARLAIGDKWDKSGHCPELSWVRLGGQIGTSPFRGCPVLSPCIDAERHKPRRTSEVAPANSAISMLTTMRRLCPTRALLEQTSKVGKSAEATLLYGGSAENPQSHGWKGRGGEAHTQGAEYRTGGHARKNSAPSPNNFPSPLNKSTVRSNSVELRGCFPAPVRGTATLYIFVPPPRATVQHG